MGIKVPSSRHQSTITGTQMAYLYLCRRKLWLHYHGFRPENQNVAVQIGKQIGDSTFQRAKKELPLGDIGVIDWAELKHGVIHETKSAKCPKNAEVAQTRYYLWWMREQGMNVDRCVVHYPKQKRTKEINWTDSMKQDVQDDLAEARRIVAMPKPPPASKLPYCRSCAFQELCFA